MVMAFCRALQQAFVTGAGKVQRRDNHCALEVRHPREVSSFFFEVRRPKCEKGSPEVLVREGREELTLRAEEVGTQKSCINVHHIAQERCGPPLLGADWHAFCHAI